MYDSIDIRDIEIPSNYFDIIDIRDKYQYFLGHIPTSKNIPYVYLIMSPETYLQKNKKYSIYCETGEKSRKICHHLEGLGFQVIDLVGGYQSYCEKDRI